jgi:hypothetical protein
MGLEITEDRWILEQDPDSSLVELLYTLGFRPLTLI